MPVTVPPVFHSKTINQLVARSYHMEKHQVDMWRAYNVAHRTCVRDLRQSKSKLSIFCCMAQHITTACRLF